MSIMMKQTRQADRGSDSGRLDGRKGRVIIHRFVGEKIGFPLPENKSEGDISGYHCWAEFYLDGVGWIPVDASEAWKNPAKRDYFFGAHDTNRVFLTYGRDIRLSPDHKGDLLIYFIYPYAEANGQPVKNLQTHFSFRDLSEAKQSRAGR